jgi:uncharacterized protein (DUF983 family)
MRCEQCDDDIDFENLSDAQVIQAIIDVFFVICGLVIIFKASVLLCLLAILLKKPIDSAVMVTVTLIYWGFDYNIPQHLVNFLTTTTH